MAASPPLFTSSHSQFLLENGYVVLEGIVEPELCEIAVQELRSAISAFDPLLFTEPGYWKCDTLPAGTVNGINRFAAHLQSQWDMRQHPKVHQVFSEFWKTSDLVVSMDAFCYYLAAGQRRDSRNWTHTDQAAHCLPDPPLDGVCLQGFVNLVDCTRENDGGLVVYKGGHKAWLGYFQQNPGEGRDRKKGNWYKYPEEFLREIEQDGSRYLQGTAKGPVPMPRTRVRAGVGALVLWYSVTPHQNDVPYSLRVPGAPPAKDRAVIYVCMAPKRYLTPKDKEVRKKAWLEKRQTSHWPAGGQVKLFPTSFKAYSKERAERWKVQVERMRKAEVFQKAPVLTPLGHSLLDV